MHYVRQAGLEDRIVSDSAGTGDYQVGAPPDARARHAAAQRGYDVSGHIARQVTRADFSEFDYVLAMDEENLYDLKRLCPAGHSAKVKLFTEFSANGARPVPDPYVGGPEGFELVLDIVEESARGLLQHVRRQLNA